MKQGDVTIGAECLTKINGKFCRVRVTARRVLPANQWCKEKTIFDWERVNPPPNARALKGSDSAATLHPLEGV